MLLQFHCVVEQARYFVAQGARSPWIVAVSQIRFCFPLDGAVQKTICLVVQASGLVEQSAGPLTLWQCRFTRDRLWRRTQIRAGTACADPRHRASFRLGKGSIDFIVREIGEKPFVRRFRALWTAL